MSPWVLQKSVSHDGIQKRRSRESLVLLNGHHHNSYAKAGPHRRSYSTSAVVSRQPRRKLLRRVSETFIPSCVS